METARGLEVYSKDMIRNPALAVGAQHFWMTPVYAMVRWGKWNEILAVPEPDADVVRRVIGAQLASGGRRRQTSIAVCDAAVHKRAMVIVMILELQ